MTARTFFAVIDATIKQYEIVIDATQLFGSENVEMPYKETEG